jgi:predicted transcriptional regulator of viral defense system
MYKNTANINKSRNFVHKTEDMNEKIRMLFRQNNGYLKRQQLSSRYMYYQLLKLVKAGIVTQPKRGVFCFDDEMHNPIDIDIESIVSDGVLCLFSAWFHYGLTTSIPHSYYIAIERKRKIVLPDYPPIILHYWQKNQYDLGISSYTKDGINIKIYDIEKSICDAVKFRNKTGMDIAIEVVKNYVGRQDRNLDKLTKYARQMRIEIIMQNMIMTML